MLLHRLIEFAARAENEERLPPAYYRPKNIQWVLLLEADGATASLIDQRVAKGSSEEPLRTNAPYAYRSGRTPPPYLCVDTAEYVLAVPKATSDGTVSEKAVIEARRRRSEYEEMLLAWAETALDEPAARTVQTFLTSEGLDRIQVPDTLAHSDNIALMGHDRWIHLLPEAQESWAATVRARKSASGGTGLCLVCGREGELLDSIPESLRSGSIPSAGRGRDAQLVSINSAAQGRSSVLQLANTPVCERCGSRMMAALNLLLADRDHRRRTTDSVTVWWTREPVDTLFESLDDPKEETVTRLVDSLHRDPDPVAAERLDPNAYYALTLGLNNARAVILDWLDIPVGRLRNHLGAWFEDHKVFDGWETRYRYLPLWHLALAAGRWDGKAGKYVSGSAPRGVEKDLLHAALTRGPAPARLLPHLLQRIRADRRVDAPRTALLRLALHPKRRDPQVTGPAPDLDDTNRDPGYLCGRIFAVLESIQRAALPDINTTIGDKYFGTAMTAPAAVLTNLRITANGHLKRLRRDRPGTYYALNTRLSEAFASLADRTDGIPRLLNTPQQAWFVLGYEQQRAADNAARAAHRRQGAKPNGDDPEGGSNGVE
ncbi:type I-C CRISPR-associated protein Cas8c/Csd1 [Streptomyces buecherae]|uniref:Type I-C CRISPR-associated protein Cas8c/Csd1 n=1 Tax=Streptomyces buecherae TaxID=2763006 RepID=A0A7H8NGL6_9ACTN|nr:type I-C CRISPR-associated protein Cas8c/Csd1 [Streptomyces buecherae]QKW53550.1 type I-C CRISPR-associated protein Cas8c/Csd1 [Streptomyces buecherae]